MKIYSSQGLYCAGLLTLSQPEGADYAHHITTGTPGWSDLPTALLWIYVIEDKWFFFLFLPFLKVFMYFKS